MTATVFRLAKKERGRYLGCGPQFQSREDARAAAPALNDTRLSRRQKPAQWIVEVDANHATITTGRGLNVISTQHL